MKRSLLETFGIALALACVLLAIALAVLPFFGYELLLREHGGVPGQSLLSLDALDPGDSDDGLMLPPTLQQPDAEARPRNLVILLADGVGFPHLMAARAALVGARGRLTVERFPVTSWHTTFNLDAIYTDSAAGATALSTGVATTPGRLAMDRDGRPVPTLMQDAMAAGRSVAVVTDSYLWDASPSAFLVHAESRREYPSIARQMAESGVSVAFGEARSRDQESVDPQLAPFRQGGFRIVRSGGELEQAAATPSSEPMIGLFPPGDIADPDEGPDLPELARLALERLAMDPEGFVLFVESEEIDSGAHNGDLDRVVDGLRALDEIARDVVRFAGSRDDTLVVFTGDHETGGLALGNVEDGQPLRAMWAWGHHTGAPVPILAWGPGAQQLAGVRASAEVGQLLRRLMSSLPDDASDDDDEGAAESAEPAEPEADRR